MLTKNEITALNLSPTKKDFVQIWNELLEVAGKLSERWDPTSTNESDPGIVILKALTGIADKLNYNIDKNTLEAFMPTAAQEDSMRKLCDMLGYNIKYYRSAETEVTIKYHSSDPSDEEKAAMKSPGLELPKFTVITNSDQDVNYFIIDRGPEYPAPAYISSAAPSRTFICMEGQVVKCEGTADNNVITAAQISENNRFYLPESQIAENGIFVYNVFGSGNTLVDGTPWSKVDNLNILARGSRVFKFGYDSYESRPYIEFPEDYSELINDGLFIYYTRTSGANGNVSPRTLTRLELPSSWTDVSADSFNVENTFAATSGANIETIKQAYNNFKKTVGTFDTLVTCRDYMNKIYAMTSIGKPLVSNALVTDIRNDINRAVTICSCDDAGIFYKETPLTETVTKTLKVKNSTTTVEVEDEEPAINHFKLVFYPFKSYSQIRGNVKDIQEVYDDSFTYTTKNVNKIKQELAAFQTIAHDIVLPRKHDIVSINNYLKLNAIIGTNSKITEEEGTILKETIKIALANAFNMRELDFGEEIPFESIVEVIEQADPRIKIVSLNEPALYTTFSVFEGNDNAGNPVLREYAVASEWLTEEEADTSDRFDFIDTEKNPVNTFNTQDAKKIYNKLAVRNVLAGRVPLFKYNNTFNTSFSEGAYRVTVPITENIPEELPEPTKSNPFTIWTDGVNTYTAQYKEDATIVYTKTYVPDDYADNIITKDADDNNITEITTDCKIYTDKHSNSKHISEVILADGEFIKFKAPNFITAKTYPAYVNYHLALNKDLLEQAQAAEATNLFTLLNGDGTTGSSRWEMLFDYFRTAGKKQFTLTQKISPVDDESQIVQQDDFTIKIDNTNVETLEETPADILAKSGCVQLTTPSAILRWYDPDTATSLSTGPELDVTVTLASNFITQANDFEVIKSKVNEWLANLIANDKLPDACKTRPWTIAFKFEYVPFEASTLRAWENFIGGRFSYASENGIILWRAYGEGYAPGKHVLSSTAKLMPFTSSYFGLLNNFRSRLHGVYVMQSPGRDQKANFINNNEEYRLRDNEYLYIEYTPSTTNEDGTTQTQEPVKELYGKDTIIRPTGFAAGLIDSSAYTNEGHSPHKTVNFVTGSSSEGTDIQMHSLGANEQIEIRDFARTVLDRDSFTETDSAVVYVYKNFNNCPELERIPTDGSGYENGVRKNSTYTLKDGEYIFYTDQNKTEFAYFTTGTEVTLTGKVIIPERNIVDLSTILDAGPQEIDWYAVPLAAGDSIIFQENQYITLSAGDTLKDLTPLFDEEHRNQTYIDKQWQWCDNVAYVSASSDEVSKLPKINTYDSATKGCGWEVCSLLELNVGPNNAQTLRATDKVTTGVTLHKTSDIGLAMEDTIRVVAEDAAHPLSFKTNLACQTVNGSLNIEDVYVNPDNLKSFELKVFSDTAPAILKTEPGKVVPYRGLGVADITSWASNKPVITKNYNELWRRVLFTELVDDTSDDYENALKLSISVLPNTYGIFSIYLDYAAADTTQETWIEIVPGASTDSISILNAENTEWRKSSENNDAVDQLLLNPGLNCLRVTNTCDIFIKTTKTSTGAIYFDELRLVDISYLKDTQNKVKATFGLNLDQLGYLDATDENSRTFSVFDMRVRKKFKTDDTNKALAELDRVSRNTTQSFNSDWKDLTSENSDKLQKLTEFLSTAIKELNEIHKSDNNDLAYRDVESLFNNYKAVSADLELEVNLQEALLNNTDVDALEQQLINALSNFTDISVSRYELLKELNKLRELAVENTVNFVKAQVKEDCLEDFSANADDLVKEELKLASLEKINEHYTMQLAAIAENLVNVADSNDYANMVTALEKLNITKHTELLNQINSLVIDRQESIYEATQATRDAAMGKQDPETTNYVVDYTEVAKCLNDLRSKISDSELNLLLTKIEASAKAGLYNDLAIEVANLRTSISDETSAISTAISNILVAVQANIAQNIHSQDHNIIEDIDALTADISEEHNTQIAAVLSAIDKLLQAAQASYTNALNDLNKTQDEQTIELVAQLKSITDARTATANIVNESFIVKEAHTTLPFGEEAVLAVWPEHMIQRRLDALATLYTAIRKLINGNGTKSVCETAFNNLPVGYPWRSAANIDAFTNLYERSSYLTNEELQNEKREELVNDISKLIDLSPELKATMNELANSGTTNKERNAVICELIDSLSSADSAIEKQKLLQKLTTELAAKIAFDTSLVEVSAKLLCPSILRFEEDWPELQEDEFYSGIRNYIGTVEAKTGVKYELLQSSSADINTKLGATLSTFTATHGVVEDLNNNFTESDKFKTWLVGLNADKISKSKLSASFTNKLLALQKLLARQTLITDIKNCNLFDLLKPETTDLTAAWEVTETTLEKNGENKTVEVHRNYWMDSAGKYFKKYINSQWYSYEEYTSEDLRDLSGDWFISKTINGKPVRVWKNSLDEDIIVDVKRPVDGIWKYDDANDTDVDLDIKFVMASDNFLLGATLYKDKELRDILYELVESVSALGSLIIPSNFKYAYHTALLEEQLLAEIRAIDKNRDFYYNAPIETNLAIDFNEGDAKLNTLMNPHVNYDINNMNNSFVISKLDINYLTKGLQIARSSRLS